MVYPKYRHINGSRLGTAHNADIYMAESEKEVHLKCPLQPHTYHRCLDDVFIAWTHGEDSFMDYLHIVNDHELAISFKYVERED